MNIKLKPIGIFDSGIGGLTVVREALEVFPNENIIYFGDTARVPYGSKSKSTIIKFSTENILFLLKKKVKLVIVACNTSSSLAAEHLRSIFRIPIIGVVEAGVAMALKATKNKKIAVVGTVSTIKSKSYEKELLKKDSSVKLYSKSCPLFVPFVEEGILSGPLIDSVVEHYLKSFKGKAIDTIILGCTHYPLINKAISKYLKGKAVIDSARAVALYSKQVLAGNNLLNPQKRKGSIEIYVTDEPVGFDSFAGKFLKKKLKKPKVVTV
ncbi:MAG: glutamate racemase [Candidatus Omnitrophota bacterium]